MGSVELRLVETDGTVGTSSHSMYALELTLQFRGIASIGDQLSQLTRLNDVWLDQNKLTDVPAGLLCLSDLHMLSMANNRLTSLRFGEWPHLIAFSAAYNKLTSVPASISNLRQLARLALSANRLVTLPPELAELQRLQTLHLDQNELEWLPVELDGLPTTTYVRLDLNPSLPLRVGFNENTRRRFDELFSQTTHLGMIRRRAVELAIGLQDLSLPALVTLEIVDAAFPNAIPMHKKWDLITAAKHFHQRRR